MPKCRSLYEPGMCSRSYKHYCACGKQLDARLAALSGQQLAPRTDVNREDWTAINLWVEAAVKKLGQLELKPAAETGGVCSSFVE